jgi:hypothetical protein
MTQRQAILYAALCLLPAWAVAESIDRQDLPCGLVEPGSIHIDGLVSDWEGVEAVDLKVSGRTLAARVRCNYDDQALYLLVEVEDDIVVRTRAAPPTDDHLELLFAGPGGTLDRLLLFPGLFSEKLPRQTRWLPARGRRGGCPSSGGPPSRSTTASRRRAGARSCGCRAG